MQLSRAAAIRVLRWGSHGRLVLQEVDGLTQRGASGGPKDQDVYVTAYLLLVNVLCGLFENTSVEIEEHLSEACGSVEVCTGGNTPDQQLSIAHNR